MTDTESEHTEKRYNLRKQTAGSKDYKGFYYSNSRRSKSVSHTRIENPRDLASRGIETEVENEGILKKARSEVDVSEKHVSFGEQSERNHLQKAKNFLTEVRDKIKDKLSPEKQSPGDNIQAVKSILKLAQDTQFIEQAETPGSAEQVEALKAALAETDETHIASQIREQVIQTTNPEISTRSTTPENAIIIANPAVRPTSSVQKVFKKLWSRTIRKNRTGNKYWSHWRVLPYDYDQSLTPEDSESSDEELSETCDSITFVHQPIEPKHTNAASLSFTQLQNQIENAQSSQPLLTLVDLANIIQPQQHSELNLGLYRTGYRRRLPTPPPDGQSPLFSRAFGIASPDTGNNFIQNSIEPTNNLLPSEISTATDRLICYTTQPSTTTNSYIDSHSVAQSHSDTDPLFNDFSSDEELEMAYMSPTIFRGTSQENAIAWLRHAHWWVNTTRAGTSGDIAQKLQQLAVLFQDKAQKWFASLKIGRTVPNDPNVTVIRCWEDFEKAFLEKFKRNDADRTSDVAALIQMKQGTNQSVEDFVNEVTRQGDIINATDQEIYMAVVTGLGPNIKSQIMQFNPTTVDEIVKRGQMAERYPINSVSRSTTPPNYKTTDAKLDKLILALTDMHAKPRPGSPAATRGRSPTPTRVRFASDEPSDRRSDLWRSPESTGKMGSNQQNMNSRPIYANSYQQPPNYSQNYTQQPTNTLTTYTPYQNYGFYGEHAHNFQPAQLAGRGRGRGQYRAYDQSNESCGRCGKGHGRGANCPAWGTTCTLCGKRNHWRRCCRNARGNYGRPEAMSQLMPPYSGGPQ